MSGAPGVVGVAAAPPPGDRVVAYAYWSLAYAASARLKPANVPAVPLGPAALAAAYPGGKLIGSAPGAPASRSASAESSMAAIPFQTSLMQKIGAGVAGGVAKPKIGTPFVSRVSATSIMLYASNVFMTPVISDASLAEYAGVTFGTS